MPRLRTSDRLQPFFKEYGYVRFTSRGGDAALVNVTFEGKPCAVPAGKTVAAALLGDAHAGYTSIHPLTGERRAPFCMMGTCFECLVEIDGQPNRQACLTIVREGMDIKRQYPDKEQER